MTTFKARFPKLLMMAMIVLLVLFMATVPASADTDEILNFTITVDVNEDASLDMTYHIEWKVLDDSIGELDWIDLGVPNKYHTNITPLTDTIDYITDYGDELYIYLDRGYGEDEIVTVEFSMTQDHMYQIDKYTEGETVYSFTPAWFDEMDVDELVIRWNADKAGAWQPDCYRDGDYLTFEAYYPYKYNIEVVYPNDAYGFSIENQQGNNGGGGGGNNYGPSAFDIIFGLIGIVFALAAFAAPFVIVFLLIRTLLRGLGFVTA